MVRARGWQGGRAAGESFVGGVELDQRGPARGAPSPSTTTAGIEPLAFRSLIGNPAAEAPDRDRRYRRCGRAAHHHARAVGQPRIDDRVGLRVLAQRAGDVGRGRHHFLGRPASGALDAAGTLNEDCAPVR